MTHPPSLTPISANPNTHLMDIAQITSDTYANGEYVQEISQQYFANAHYDWDVTQLIWDGDQLIHHWGVWCYPMRIGTVQLKVAGIGAVVTREPYRKQGLMRKAALASFQAMAAYEYDLTILRGRYYAQFGFVRAWNYVTYRLQADEIPSLTAALEFEYYPLGPEHVADITNLYNDFYADFSGTAVRPTYGMLNTGDMNAFGWLDENGHLRGYVRAKPTEDEKSLQCVEAVGDVDTCFAILADLFNKETYETLSFFSLPHHHPLLQRVRRGACVVKNQYFRHNGWQVRLVNLHGALQKLRPLLQQRLWHSDLIGWVGDLGLDAGDQKATLTINKGRIQVNSYSPQKHIVQAGPAMARLLIGSDEPTEILQQESIHCSGLAQRLVEILFPNMHPMLSHWDEY